MGEKNNSQGFLKCKYFDQMIYTRGHLYWLKLAFIRSLPRNRNGGCANTLCENATNKTSRNLLHDSKVKEWNKIYAKFCFHRIVFTPPLLSYKSVKLWTFQDAKTAIGCKFQTFLNFGRKINRWNFKQFFLEQVHPTLFFGEIKEKSIFRECLPILGTLRKSLLNSS